MTDIPVYELINDDHLMNVVFLWVFFFLGGNYLHAHIYLRFRHVHHETKDQLPSLKVSEQKSFITGVIPHYQHF